jgi:T5orf172 domain
MIVSLSVLPMTGILCMTIEFQPTRSFAYRFSRYTILPELQCLPEAQSGEPFKLRELAWPIIDRLLTPQQQAIRVKKAQSDADEPMGQIIRFFVPLLVKELGVFENLGGGNFRSQTEAEVSETDLEDAAIDAGDEATDDLGGHIYAFSFPSIIKDGVFPVKIGKTTGDVAKRVTEQCKGSATFEQPTILGSWKVKRVGPTELAIQNILKARGKHREDAPGREWFDTTVSEVVAIIEYVQRDTI